MKFSYVCSTFTIFIWSSNCAFIDDTKSVKKIKEEKVPLKKLLHNELSNLNDDRKEIEWHVALANVLIYSIQSILYNKKEITGKIAENPDNDYLIKLISRSLLFFKNTIYDRLTNQDNRKTNEIAQTNEDFENTYNRIDIEASTKDEIYSNDIVEVLEPNYNVECINCNSTVSEDDNDCPKGFKSNKEGNCILKVSEPSTLAIPNQCPYGYKSDKNGHCRKIFKRN
ncbi:uncharacterized protein LOC113522158 [Galleria mellonella]|uniref:Uncharacterized protein LOC113522158 n=1 Tax=Galleria mellonella TaxID=7137 RepID=A0A6J1X8C7_GALME|nr:uncharacterized protein LOC113522158 [Galleria mellonella]